MTEETDFEAAYVFKEPKAISLRPAIEWVILRTPKQQQFRMFVAMTVQAIADFLTPPCPSEIPLGRKGNRIREKEEARKTAFRWLFNDYADEFGFKDVCLFLGIPLNTARQALVIILNSRIEIPEIPGATRIDRIRHLHKTVKVAKNKGKNGRSARERRKEWLEVLRRQSSENDPMFLGDRRPMEAN